MATLIAYRIDRAQASIARQGGVLPMVQPLDWGIEPSPFSFNYYVWEKLPHEDRETYIKERIARLRETFGPIDTSYRDRYAVEGARILADREAEKAARQNA